MSVADTIFYGGCILTMNEPGVSGDETQVEAVAVANQKIIAVGSVDEVFKLKGDKTEAIFLNNQTMLPGFIEPHQHAIQCALMRSMYVNISALQNRSYADVSKVMNDTLTELAADPDNKKWAIFFGWDPELISDLPFLSANYLDQNYSKTIEIVVVGQSGHVAWVNNKALTTAGIDENTESPPGGTIVKDETTNLPTGQLFEEPAIMMVIEFAPMPSADDIVNDLNAQWHTYSAAGFTTVTDLAYMPNEGLDIALKLTASLPTFPIRLGLYQVTHAETDDEVANKSAKPRAVQACCPTLGRHPDAKNVKASKSAKSGKGAKRGKDSKAYEGGVGDFSEQLWEVGRKLIADGSPHCGTCATREPFMYTPLTDTLGFPKAPGYGILNMDDTALLETIKRYTLAGTQLAIHCHGERSSEQVLRVYEQVLANETSNKNRHRMEHLGLMTVEQIERAAKVNICLSFFVDHIRFYGLVYKTDIFGDRVNRWTPLSEATKHGIIWTIHQDHPTFPGAAAPFSNMITAMTRCTRDDHNTPYGPEYRVSIDEAVKSYTVNAAWQLHLDQKVGSIAVGKQADFVVLTENPYVVAAKDPFELERIQVVETYLNGKPNEWANRTTIPNSQLVVLQKK